MVFPSIEAAKEDFFLWLLFFGAFPLLIPLRAISFPANGRFMQANVFAPLTILKGCFALFFAGDKEPGLPACGLLSAFRVKYFSGGIGFSLHRLMIEDTL